MECIPHFTNHKSFEITKTEKFQEELQDVKEALERIFTDEVCAELYRSKRTNMCESKFATRLNYVPKHSTYSETFDIRVKMVDLKWDECHVSSAVISEYGKFLSKFLNDGYST